MTDQQIVEIFRARRTGPGSASSCPSPDRIWSAVEMASKPEEIEAIVDHTSACPACAAAWRLAREMGAPAPGAGAAAASGRRWRLAISLAAGLVLAAALAVQWLASGRPALGPQSRPPAWRRAERIAIESLLPEGGSLPRAACVLRWSAGPPGATYRVTVTRPDLTRVAGGGPLDKAEFTVPESALSGLPAGAALLWQVETTSPDGTREISPTFTLLVE